MRILSYWKNLLFPNLKFEFIGTIAAGVGIVSGLSSLMGGSNSSPQQNTSDSLSAMEGGWAQQLNNLMQNPSSITSMPGYQASEAQGQQTLQRGLAATGQNQSGAEQIALQNYGQQFESQAYQQQIQNLGNLVNNTPITNANPNPQQGMLTGAGNIMGGLGGLSTIYGGGAGNTNSSAMNYYNYNGSSGYSQNDPSGMGYAGSSGM